MRLMSTSMTLLLALAASCTHDANTNWDVNEILAQVLHQPNEDGAFTVVEPMTACHILPEDIRKSPRGRKHLQRSLGQSILPLFDELIRKNKEAVRLSLKSSPEDGYLIDYDGRFAKYFDQEGGGWEKWYEDNPQAHGSTRVSLPVYDQDTRLVLIYVVTARHWLSGSGYLILYKYEDGKLKELNRVRTLQA